MKRIRIEQNGHGEEVILPRWFWVLVVAAFSGIGATILTVAGGALIAWRQVGMNTQELQAVERIQAQQTAILTDMHNQFVTRIEWDQAHKDLKDAMATGDGAIHREIDQLLNGQYRTHALLEKLPRDVQSK